MNKYWEEIKSYWETRIIYNLENLGMSKLTYNLWQIE